MNRLAQESSAYLLQHRHNPVDWHPWGPAAFQRAVAEDKPIFLSVGYSACHWCHVMSYESFEDQRTANLLNAHFVCIKVDREERPDVDSVYMEVIKQITGRGGWPMTVFLMPNGVPFFGGTYFPLKARGGLPSFIEVLDRIRRLWQNQRQAVAEQADKIGTAVTGQQRLADVDSSFMDGLETQDRERAGTAMLTRATGVLASQFDVEYAGFGSQPKFPHTMSLEVLLQEHRRHKDPLNLEMVVRSLDAMASGGIYDHLGGGFCRYSVDRQWVVPHFEKMLYDNALFPKAYLHAWQVTGEPRFLRVVEETVEYVLRDLRLSGGGFAASEDADSDGKEGSFYLWSADEIKFVLGAEAQDVLGWHCVTEEGNFEGSTVLTAPLGADVPDEVRAGQRRLFEYRQGRTRPARDDKVIAEWNGLMLSTLAEAAAATQNRSWLAAAETLAEFLLQNLRNQNGRWLRSWHPDEAKPKSALTPAFAADYVALLDGFTRLAEATGDPRWIEEAAEIAEGLLELFWDDQGMGLRMTGSDAERLVTNPIEFRDHSVPSANGLGSTALLRLGALTGKARLIDIAERIVLAAGELPEREPTEFGSMLRSADLLWNGMSEVVVPGGREDLVSLIHRTYLPDIVLAWGQPFDSPLWDSKQNGFAYVCKNLSCLTPSDDARSLLGALA